MTLRYRIESIAYEPNTYGTMRAELRQIEPRDNANTMGPKAAFVYWGTSEANVLLKPGKVIEITVPES